MKAQWLHKQRFEIPAVVALVLPFDVAADVRGWSSMEQRMAADVARLRRNLGAREAVGLAVVLVQHCDYPRDMEVPKKTEIKQDRINSFRRLAEIEPKMIHLLHTADFAADPSPAVLQLYDRLQAAAEEYYSARGKRLRAQLKMLDEGSTGGLAMNARMNFKIAQFYETRRSAKALKHYEDAYDSLVEIAGREGCRYSAHEIRSMAEAVHYRLIVLHVNSRHVNSVLGQFKKHVGAMRGLRGEFGLRFLFHQWMSKQFFIFSEIIAEIRPALAMAHLSSLDRFRCSQLDYLVCAAQYAMRRRKVAQTLKIYGGGSNAAQQQALRKRNLDALLKKHRLSLSPSPFLGAPPICTSTQRAEVPPDVQNEVQIAAIQEAEGLHNQSAQVLSLLSQVSSLMTKTVHSTRPASRLAQPLGVGMSRREAQISLFIAQEHLCMGHAALAFTYLDKCVEAFRKEQWYEPLALPVRELLSHHQELADEHEMVASPRARKTLLRLFLLALSPALRLDMEKQQRVEVEQGLVEWAERPISGDHQNEEMLIESAQPSEEGVFSWSSELALLPPSSFSLTLHLRTVFVLLRVSACRVGFNDPRYDFIINHGDEATLEQKDLLHLDAKRRATARLDGLKMGGSLRLCVQLKCAGMRKEKSSLYVTSVTMEIGSAFGGSGSILLVSNLAGHVARQAALAFPGALALSKQRVDAAALRAGLKSGRVEVACSTEQPLIGQVCAFSVKVEKGKGEEKGEGIAKLTLEVVGEAELFQRVNGGWVSMDEAACKGMEQWEQREFGVGVVGTSAVKQIQVEVKASVELSKDGPAEVRTAAEKITFKPPFVATTKIEPLEVKGANLETIIEKERPFLIQVGLESCCEEELIIEKFEIESDEKVSVEAEHMPSLPLSLLSGEKYMAVMVAKAKEASEALEVGKVTLLWRRSAKDQDVNRFSARLPKVQVRQPPFRFTLIAGKEKPVGECRDVALSVQNTTQAVQKVVATLMERKDELGPFEAAEMNEKVFFVGESQHVLVIAPESTEEAKWKLVQTTSSAIDDAKVYIKAVAMRYDTVHYFTI